MTQEQRSVPQDAEEDCAWEDTQRTGLAALMALAAPLPPAMAESPTIILARMGPPPPPIAAVGSEAEAVLTSSDAHSSLPAAVRELPSDAAPASATRTRELQPKRTETMPAAPTSRRKATARLRMLRTDDMVRNSLYLILSTGLTAGFGFVFWVIMARLFSSTDVGLASSLVTATSVISFLSLLGLNSTLIGRLPTASNRNTLITASFVLVGGFGAVLAALYVAVTPMVAPRLALVEHSPALAIGFVLLTAAAGVNALTDSVFIGSRKAIFCAVTDGGVGGPAKIVIGLLLVGTGAFGLFSAATAAFAISSLVSLALIATLLKWRPSFRSAASVLRPLLRVSVSNYTANTLNLLPTLIVPLLVLDRLGATNAAYYYVAFQVGTLLYSAAYAVGQALLSEGSHVGVNRRALLRRSRMALIVLTVPTCLALIGIARWVMAIFGTEYSRLGTGCLEMLAVSAIPVAAYSWAVNVLRLLDRFGYVMLSSAAYALGICGLAWLLAPRGLTVMATAWPLGSGLAAAISCIAVAVLPRGKRHRRIP
jgi:O-antigen/teichoic acid export membrane protein